MAIGVAFRAFFAALFQREAAERIRSALAGDDQQARLVEKVAPKQKSEAKKSVATTRSDALILLSTLQREARFLDLVHESLDGFEDAQVGAAAREVLRDCRKTIDRMFAVAPGTDEEEGATIEVPRGTSPNQIRLVGVTGGVSGAKGTITHRGWKATCCELPKWTGNRNEAWILAPTEVEVS